MERAYTAHSPHSMVYPSRTQPTLDDLKAPALAQHHIRRWYADVVEEDVSVAVRCVVVPEYGEHAVDSDSRSRSWD